MKIDAPKKKFRSIRPLRKEPQHKDAVADVFDSSKTSTESSTSSSLSDTTALTKKACKHPKRWARIVFAALILMLLAASVAAIWFFRATLTVANDAVTNDAKPELRLEFKHAWNLKTDQISLTVNGQKTTAATRFDTKNKARILLPFLPDGAHQIRIETNRVGTTFQPLVKELTITVDTVAPNARIMKPVGLKQPSAYARKGTVVITKQPFNIVASSEVGSKVVLTTNQDKTVKHKLSSVKAGTRYEAQIKLPQGEQVVTLSATDKAGNTRLVRRSFLVDTSGPTVRPNIKRSVSSATLDLELTAQDPHGVNLDFSLNGKTIDQSFERTIIKPAPAFEQANEPVDATAASTSDTNSGDSEAGDTSDYPVEAKWLLKLDEPLYEGRHILTVTATDSLGSVNKIERTIIINSTNKLSEAKGLKVGAKGGAVSELHKALIDQKVATQSALSDEFSRKLFGGKTKQAVQRFQTQQGMEADGVAGSDTLAALVMKIVIDRSTKTLTLYHSGEVMHTFGVAIGSPDYPTPPGEFKIQTKEKDPTWVPPDSDWAKGAKITPPGPDNPLGTRWMSIDGPIGIHGTNNAASIGYSVSHGCIRMHIPDVEKLFDIVRIGTPVTVL